MEWEGKRYEGAGRNISAPFWVLKVMQDETSTVCVQI